MKVSGWLDPAVRLFLKELHQQHKVFGRIRIKGRFFYVVLAFCPSVNPVWLTGHYKGSVFHVVLGRVFHVILAFSPSANPVWLTGHHKGQVFRVILAFPSSAQPVWLTGCYKGRVFHVILAFPSSANPVWLVKTGTRYASVALRT